MGARFHYWLLTGLAGLLPVLVVANILLILGNSEKQREVSNRQGIIQQTQQVDLPLYRELAQALVDLARRGDTQLGYMLAGQGIQLTPQQAPAAQQAAPAVAPAAAPVAQPESGRVKAKLPPPAAPANKP